MEKYSNDLSEKLYNEGWSLGSVATSIDSLVRAVDYWTKHSEETRLFSRKGIAGESVIMVYHRLSK